MHFKSVSINHFKFVSHWQTFIHNQNCLQTALVSLPVLYQIQIFWSLKKMKYQNILIEFKVKKVKFDFNGLNMMLHTKDESSGLCCFRQEDFERFTIISLCKLWAWTHLRGSISVFYFQVCLSVHLSVCP